MDGVAIPRIPRQEFARRRRALLEALAPHGLEAVVAYGDDGQFAGGAHVRWLTDFQPHFEPVLVACRGGTTLLLSGAETAGLARLETEGADIGAVLAISELAVPGLEYASIPLVSGVDELRDLFAGLDRVAFLGEGDVRASVARSLLEPLAEAGVALVPSERVALELRARKHAAEHAVLDAAYAATASAMRRVAAALADGASEREAAAEGEHALRRAGAETWALDTMVGSGERSATVLARTTERRPRPGDVIAVTLLPRFEGYCISLARPFVLGANRAAERAVEAAWRAQAAAAELVVANAPGAAATEAARAAVRAAALDATVDEVWVHSTGLVEFEPPFFGPGSPALLLESMAISVDVPLFHAPWGGLRIEDGYEVAGDGCRPRLEDARGLVPVRI